ncbi:glycosyltransferase [Arthrobacter sp. C9C5]|uniref:glycosyltransferase n=1 Tax=Arthrobacter sp. C9C5 TaxID=2735267 RepID=UPI001584C3C3|nr:glycosyltransferase [Arthrobacter sp. C9C5]NUU31987.1 glycosyltransferase [Arthrobacter sp. C9C5]
MGSEPGAGWEFARAAAVHSEVWVITRPRFEPLIAHALAAEPVLAPWIHPVYVDLPDWCLRLKKHHRDVYWYYPLWQRLAGQRALDLHREAPFDVAHHVTFASDWMPCGLTALPPTVPLVWGPVGGASYVPVPLLRWLGLRGAAAELARRTVTGACRRAIADRTARRAQLVVGLNDDVRRRFAGTAAVVVEPNAVVDPAARGSSGSSAPSRVRTAVFVGRLVSWKGTRLAVKALSHPAAANWKLEFIGAGPDQRWLEAEAARRGISDRVTCRGQLPREAVLAALDAADAMLFPSLHDSAPWVVAEACAAGLPVICVDLGGPPIFVRGTADGVSRVVDVGPGLPARLAVALRDSESVQRPTPSDRWSSARMPALLEAWYGQAAQFRAGRDAAGNGSSVSSEVGGLVPQTP